MLIGMSPSAVNLCTRCSGDPVTRLGNVAAYFKQLLRDKLIEHRQYIIRHGEGMPDIRNWKWNR
jgi:phosphoketolase